MVYLFWSQKCNVVGQGGVLRAASENYKKIRLDYPKQLCTQLALYKEHRARSSEPWILALDLLLTLYYLGKVIEFPLRFISDYSCEHQWVHLGCLKMFSKP